ncbi:polysaccharide export protein [Novosphingobium sp. MW5]|nr:polysaccharide export protein [Novosphingobium sp. MW5]
MTSYKSAQNRKTQLLALCGLVLLAGCASTPKLGGDKDLTVISSRDLPPPTVKDFSTQSRPYIVGPFDRLVIDVFGIEGLSDREVQVDAGGKISFPLVGVIEIAGQTPAEVEMTLISRLRAAYVRSPQVTVNVKEAVSQVVTVDGQVKKPGLFPIIGRMTLMRVIAKAEGTDEFSNLEDVVIFRTVNGRRLAALYNLDGIRHGAFPDPDIYPNDVVMVGDDNSRRLFKDFLTTFSLVSGPLVIALDRLAN